jgi:hypothetical protein
MKLYKHHIIPRCMGGSDEPSNIREVTHEEHIQLHKELMEKYPHVAGLAVAYRMLSGLNGDLLLAGAASGGIKAKALNLGWHTDDESLLFQWRSSAGKAAVLTGAQSKAGLASSKKGVGLHKPGQQSKNAQRANRKVISLDDGKVINNANRTKYERKTGYIHTWVDL